VAWQQAKADILKNSEKVAAALDTLANERRDQIRNAYPLNAVAEAREREEALMMHLEDKSSYHGSTRRRSRAAPPAAGHRLERAHHLVPDGHSGRQAAFPVNLEDTPIAANGTLARSLRDWLDDQIRENAELDDGPAPTTVSLPTPGIAVEPRLGSCNACEDFIEESRAVDLRQRKAAALQVELEAKRQELRLGLDEPNLDDPSPGRHEPTLTVKLVQPPATPPTI
jgi:hypothetical protein